MTHETTPRVRWKLSNIPDMTIQNISIMINVARTTNKIKLRYKYKRGILQRKIRYKRNGGFLPYRPRMGQADSVIFFYH